MSPERWAAVVTVFDQAVECPPDSRGALLDRACAADTALRTEVESLLAADAAAPDFLETLARGSAAVVDALHRQFGGEQEYLADEPADEPAGGPALGARVQHALGAGYRVERELAGGGMSRVFVAEDLALDRRVAVKVVLASARGAAFNVARFRREVRLAATLRHPHIVPLLAAGESADGLVYYTMPFVEGESLRHRLDRERVLPIDEVVRVVSEVADALAYAHRRGVIHRDVKPANLLVDEEHVLVADFGIAKALSAATAATEHDAGAAAARPARADPDAGLLTAGGVVLGTPAYLSPEQAAGDQTVDVRTDVYSLGCVAYHMLTGAPPPAAAAAGHRQRPPAAPAPVTARRADAPPGVDAVVARALARAPDDRWPTPTAFARALAAAAGPAGREAHDAPPRPRWRLPRRRWLDASLAGALGLVALAAVGRAVLRPHDPTGTAALAALRPAPRVAAGGRDAVTTLAVLPFGNLGSTADLYFADGLADELRSRLGGVTGLRLASSRSVGERAGTGQLPADVGKALGVDYVLGGSVRWDRAGAGAGRVQVMPELVRVRDRAVVWTGRYDAAVPEVFEVERAIGERAAAAMAVAPAPGSQESLAARPTDDFEAYNYFLRAEALRKSTTDEGRSKAQAVALYERATARDPGFALAYARLAETHSEIYWSNTDRSAARLARVERAATTAVRLAPELPEAHLALALFHYRAHRDYARALAELDAAIARAPNRSDLLAWRGLIQRRQGRFGDAVASLRRADELEPSDPWRASDVAFTYLVARAYPEAAQYYDRVRTLAPAWPVVHADRAFLMLSWHGDVAGARRIVHDGLRTSAPGELAARLGADAPLLVAPGADTRLVLRAVSAAAFKGDTSSYMLWYAEWWRQHGDAARRRAYADSARAGLERALAAGADEPGLHSELALAYAHLGRTADAVRESDRAVALLPVARDALDGASYLQERAQVYALVGQYDAAIAELRRLLAMPSFVSVPLLRVSPAWQVLRARPGFARLVGE